MKTLLHSGASRLLTLIYALALSGILPACTDDADRELPDSGKGGTVTLELSLSVPPIVETKAVICEADSASEARKAGFYYEMQVQTTDTTGNNGGHVATKAASSLKNIYAFLFRTDNGAFNGRASIKEAVDLTEKLKLVFSDVTDVDSRLVIIANDAAAETDYTSSRDFANFSGTYTEFQNLMLTSGIKSDADIPYVGSTMVSLGDGVLTAEANVLLYRMLAKITLTNNYAIDDGVLRNSIILYNAGNKYFDSGNGYDGNGTTPTALGRYTFIAGKNDDINTWYVGENVQADSTNAAYIEFLAVGEGSNTNPSVGEEYKISGYALRHKVYLEGLALKRNNVYTINVNMSGNFDFHKKLATTNPDVSYTESEVVHGGLNIGMYGGAEGYTQGSGEPPTISGTYTKYLLLQPNTSGTAGTDTETKEWSASTGTTYQTDTRKYWDPTYTLADEVDRIDKGVGYAYDYCKKLTIGGVSEGTWYLPTIMQLQAIYGIWGGIKKDSSYENYSGFVADGYWSATESHGINAWRMYFNLGRVLGYTKANPCWVRCVRDLPLPILSAQTVTIDGDGYPVIDLSALQPSGIVLSFAEASNRRTEMKDATPYNNAYMSVGAAVSGFNGTWNAQMSGKFQVMCEDHTDGSMNWATAYNRCKSYNGEGSRAAGEWRLPTQRELMQIMILHPQLINKGDFQALTANAYYWSLTEYNASGVWFLNTTYGQMDYDENNKTKDYRVRCIRDVE